jgi:hypothetical protein
MLKREFQMCHKDKDKIEKNKLLEGQLDGVFFSFLSPERQVAAAGIKSGRNNMAVEFYVN